MSINSINLSTFKQTFIVDEQNKKMYGEVSTDFHLVNRILDLLPSTLFENPNLKWLDPCAGRGYFSMVLYKRLFKSLQNKIKSEELRHKHIIQNMIWMIELNPEHIPSLHAIFGKEANICEKDFLTCSDQCYDVIIGNPPYNAHGSIKVPTNKNSKKKKDGVSIWRDFVKTAIFNLKDNGYLAMITPSIWMKNDQELFRFLQQWDIEKIHCMTNTETNLAFHMQAQTPTCFFNLHKIPRKNAIQIYDNEQKQYIEFDNSVYINKLFSLPLFAPSIIKKLIPFVRKVGYLNVKKTSMRPDYKNLTVTKIPDDVHKYPNIKTCILNKLQPEMIVNFSNRKCVYSGVPKLILAHKMYGFPFIDTSGLYGISNRDNYVITGKNDREYARLKQFLSTKLAFVVYKSTRYRMRYLEKYAFEFLPDITKLHDFPENITNETVSDYFKLNEMERKCLETVTKKEYLTF